MPHEALSKYCPRCERTLSLSSFAKDRQRRDGLQAYCRECRSAISRHYVKVGRVAEYTKAKFKDPARKEKILVRARMARNSPAGKAAAQRRHQRYKRERPETLRAHRVVCKAVASGTLNKLPCAKCGAARNVHAHHDDYSKPLSVIWLCPKHHKERHIELGWGHV